MTFHFFFMNLLNGHISSLYHFLIPCIYSQDSRLYPLVQSSLVFKFRHAGVSCPDSYFASNLDHIQLMLPCYILPLAFIPCLPCLDLMSPLVSFFLFFPPSFSSSWHKGKLFYLQKPLPKSHQNGMLCFITTGGNIRSLITNFEWPGIPDFYWTYLKSLF